MKRLIFLLLLPLLVDAATFGWSHDQINTQGYRLYRGPQGGPYSQVQQVSVPNLSLQDTPPVGQHYYVVRAYNASGESNNSNELAFVQSAPLAADFSCSPLSGPPPLIVNCSDQSGGWPTAWSWDFGDGGTSTVQNPQHTYTSGGQKTVSLNTRYIDAEAKPGLITVGGSMAFTFRSASTVINGTTITKPSGVASGDLLVAFAYSTDTSIAAPTGWTVITTGAHGFSSGWWKVAGAGEPANYTWTSSSYTSIDMVAYSGATGILFDEFQLASEATSDTSFNPAQVTADQAEELIIYFCNNNEALVTHTFPSGTTERADSDGLGVGDEIQAGSGLSTARTITSNNAVGTKSMITAAFKSDIAAAGQPAMKRLGKFINRAGSSSTKVF